MYSNIYINSSGFHSNNIASRYGNGGAIYYTGNFQVNNTMFIDNSALIIQCQFINNLASGSGEAMYIYIYIVMHRTTHQ